MSGDIKKNKNIESEDIKWEEERIRQGVYKLIRDFLIVLLSIFIAVMLSKSNLFFNFLTASREAEILGSFFAGLFFTSVFTVAPATVTLIEIAQSSSVILTALIGGAGALIGDLLIFRFVRDDLSEDIVFLVRQVQGKRLLAVFRLKSFKWLIVFFGALIVASPLPDEIGLAMLGLTKIKTRLFIPVFYLLNSIGILIISLIAKNL